MVSKNERAIVAGIGSFTKHMGMIIALAVNPMLVSSFDDGSEVIA